MIVFSFTPPEGNDCRQNVYSAFVSSVWKVMQESPLFFVYSVKILRFESNKRNMFEAEALNKRLEKWLHSAQFVSQDRNARTPYKRRLR